MASAQASMPYFLLNNQTGTDNPLFAQVWWPNIQRDNNYVFIDANGGYSPVNHASNAELGVDYRHLFNQHWALGVYNYVSFNYSAFKQSFFSWNPGVEFLNKNWQLNWDAYVPLSNRSKNSGDWVWADSVGIYTYMRFIGHNQYNQLVRETSTVGVGTDLIASYRFDKLFNLKASLGSYYFDVLTHPVGVVFKLATPVRHHLSFSLSATHDPMTRNSVNFGVSLHFGNDESLDKDWINERVQHNLPLAVGANTIPINNSYQAEGIERLQKDNVWFFSTDGAAYDSSLGLQNCTFENPCSGLSTPNLAHIDVVASTAGFNNDPSIYLKPGSYSPGELVLFNNESVIGRSSDYKRAAEADERAVLNTPRIILAQGANTLANLQLLNVGGTDYAILAVRTNPAVIDNVSIGPDFSGPTSQQYYRDLLMLFNSKVEIKNSTLNASNALTATGATINNVVVGGDDGELDIENSTLNAYLIDGGKNALRGIDIFGNTTISVNNSTFNQAATNLTDSVFNVFDDGDHDVSLSINNSTLNASVASTDGNGGIFGIVLNSNSLLKMTNSHIVSRDSSMLGDGFSINTQLSDNTQATITNSRLESYGEATTQTGSTNVTAADNANVIINGGVFQTEMAGGPRVTESSAAVPLWARNDSTITVNNATIIARSLNSDTGAAPLQAQNQTGSGATIIVNNCKIYAYSLFGNTTQSSSTPIIAGDTSQIILNSSTVTAYASGQSDYDLDLVAAIDQSQITVNNTKLIASNLYTSTGRTPKTYGLSASDNGTIINNNTRYSFRGNPSQQTSTTDNGRIITQ